MENSKVMKAHQVLNKALLAKQKRNPQYSQRALARDLGTSPVFVTKILTGKKSVPPARFKSLFKILDMDITLQTELMRAALLESLPSPELRSMAKLSLAKDPAMEKFRREPSQKMSVIKNWYNIAILNYISCERLNDSSEAIAKYFGLTLREVNQSLQTLEANGLIEKENGQWGKVEKNSYFPTTKSQSEVRDFHRQMIQKSYQELSNTTQGDFDKRLITGFTIAADTDKIDLAKKMISEFLGELSEILGGDKSEEVYQCNIQLFPLKKNIRGGR